jgi:hypothetical protein
MTDALPRRQPPWPLLGVDSWRGGSGRGTLSGVPDLPHQWLLSSGRAALLHGLKSLGAAAGARVGVPSYHCPTMVAPIAALGASPVFYALTPAGQADPDSLAAHHRQVPLTAVIASHLFAHPGSLATLRGWCDQEGVALVEDCAHALWGQAGERPVGHWGDVATASLAKFLPLPEGGLMASARPLSGPVLHRPSLRTELKTVKDLFDRRRIGRAAVPAAAAVEPVAVPTDSEIVRSADMGRVDRGLPIASRWLWSRLPWDRAARRRRGNWQLLAGAFGEPHDGMQPLWPDRLSLGPGAAPYVFPLWVDEPEPVYARLRCAGCAVMRWDRVWPGAPPTDESAVDPGILWRRHVLQLLVHQDLDHDGLHATIRCLRPLTALGRAATAAHPDGTSTRDR